MLKSTGYQLDALELAKQAKKQNIIDMAVGFTAMMPLFQERSADLIKEKLEDIYRKSYPPRYLWTIKMIDKEDYDLLQKVIRQDIRDSFDDIILAVQYDDIMGRRLNRVPDS